MTAPAGASDVTVIYRMPSDESGALRVRFPDGEKRRANPHGGGLYPLASELGSVLELVLSIGEDITHTEDET